MCDFLKAEKPIVHMAYMFIIQPIILKSELFFKNIVLSLTI